MTRRICDVMHDTEVVILPPSATVHAAAAAMTARQQCVVLVMTAERLQGIFTEQDIVRRVVAERRDPDKVTLVEVMTGCGFLEGVCPPRHTTAKFYDPPSSQFAN